MHLPNLSQDRLNTTLIGVLCGALRYHQLPSSPAWAFGISGHAFVINIHPQLCPSGPYCFRREAVYNLAAHLGLRIEPLGFFSNTSSPADRSAVEAALRSRLDAGIPCMVINLENQLITGHDGTGFTLTRPWPNCEFTPPRLTFGSWAEFGPNPHVDFAALHRTSPARRPAAIAAALDYAIDLHDHPDQHTDPPYTAGNDAYSHWIAAIRAGHGNSHGHWWNATVYAECRAHAADFFREVTPLLTRPELGPVLAEHYAAAGAALQSASEKSLAPEQQIALLKQAETHDRACALFAGKMLAS